MAGITYEAKRKLMTGHEVDETYSFDLPVSVADSDGVIDRNTSTSLSGIDEDWLNRVDELIDFTSVYMEESSDLFKQAKEFMYSTAGGEVFTIDKYGTIDDPIEPIQVKRIDKNNKESRSGTNFYVSYSFKVKVIA